MKHNPSEMLPFRWGIGKLACDAVAKEKNGEDEHVKYPLIVPYHHVGSDKVLPDDGRFIPNTGHKVSVLWGEPVPLNDLLQKCEKCATDQVKQQQLWKAITERAEEHLRKLRKQHHDYLSEAKDP